VWVLQLIQPVLSGPPVAISKILLLSTTCIFTMGLVSLSRDEMMHAQLLDLFDLFTAVFPLCLFH
jgi:hypothetical protein